MGNWKRLTKFFLLSISAFYLFVSLVTHRNSDCSFNTASAPCQTANLGLRPGAYISDLLLQIFGIGSIVICLFLAIAAKKTLSGQSLTKTKAFLYTIVATAACSGLMPALTSKTYTAYTNYYGFTGNMLAKLPQTPYTHAAMLLLACCCLVKFYAPILKFRKPNFSLSKKPKAAQAQTNEPTSFDREDECDELGTSVDRKYELNQGLRNIRCDDEDEDEDYEDENWDEDNNQNEGIEDGAAGDEDDEEQIEELIETKNNENEDHSRKIDPKDSMPSVGLLEQYDSTEKYEQRASMEKNAQKLVEVLKDFGISGQIVNTMPGPVVTLYELEPAPGIKSSRVIGLATDIARSMSTVSVRIAVVPGKNVIGIEIPNATRNIVGLRSILETDEYINNSQHKLPLALGITINGKPVVADLAKMPHLLVAGTTGSGKSVAINTMIMSLLYCLSYEECRFIMIDPKMLELSLYNDIPHLIAPVVTDPKKAVIALKWVVGEMESRYRLMSQIGVRNIDGYNQKIMKHIANKQTIKYRVQSGFDEKGSPVFKETVIPARKMFNIVVVVDEMADLMLLAGKEIESLIQRLAQMARAAGIHIIMATQRPSVDVITGVIKANFPTRISFAVTSKIDSRTILGEQGAEALLGMGDMLYMGNGSKIQRLHGPFISDKEIQNILHRIKDSSPPQYLNEINMMIEKHSDDGSDNENDDEDTLYNQAVNMVRRERKISISFLQRQFKIGFNKAALLVERMEKNGVISPQNGAGKRTVLIS